MISKERRILIQIIKSWAQDHDPNFQIASPKEGDTGMDATSAFFSWLIKQTEANIDLTGLLDRLELYILHVKNKNAPDGRFCRVCRQWNQFAEPNQDDGSLICYSCRTNPYH